MELVTLTEAARRLGTTTLDILHRIDAGELEYARDDVGLLRVVWSAERMGVVHK